MIVLQCNLDRSHDLNIVVLNLLHLIKQWVQAYLFFILQVAQQLHNYSAIETQNLNHVVMVKLHERLQEQAFIVLTGYQNLNVLYGVQKEDALDQDQILEGHWRQIDLEDVKI